MQTLTAGRWRGQPGRLEVWYTTITDPLSGNGFWLHSEVVAPIEGQPYLHGWAAAFPADGPPVWERFAPSPASPGAAVDELRGTTHTLSWDLRRTEDGTPLFTFPRWAWERELLPAAQVVPAPTASYDGFFSVGDRRYELSGARGASARIYGHGNAKRWAWLHADLGDGDVLELVSAVSMRPGLSALPPTTLLQLRVDGRDLPREPLAAAPLLRARLGLPEWSVRGMLGRHRLHVRVRQDPERSVVVPYVDPDGATATCHNSEVASAQIRLDRLTRSGWVTERCWRLDGTAHAEVGVRP